MNSLADLPDEFHCHRIFIKILEGISDVNIAEPQVLNSERTTSIVCIVRRSRP